MTDEYLARSSLVARMKYYDEHTTEGSGEHYAYSVALREIRNAPAADVAPVVHGEWYLLDDCANAGLYCSVCSRRVHREEFAYKKLRSKYCPHCGAKMDGGSGNG